MSADADHIATLSSHGSPESVGAERHAAPGLPGAPPGTLAVRPERTEFRFLSNRSVRHEPTGYMLTTYGYDHPREACWSVVETRGAAEKPTPWGIYRREDLAQVARRLLRERAEDLSGG